MRRTPDGRQTVHPLDHVVVAAGFGLATALAELLVIAFQWMVIHRIIWTGFDVFWMVPLSYVAVFLCLGVAAGVLSALPGVRLPLGITAGVAAGIATFSLAFLLAGHAMALAAMLLLALGGGMVSGRAIERNAVGFAGRAWRFVPLLAIMVTLIAVGRPLVAAFKVRWIESTLPAARPSAPNILLVIFDTVRAASLDLYGYDRPTTPSLSRWARDGVVFDRAIATASWTLPSHASIFTGQEAAVLSANWLTPLDASSPTLAEVLRGHGYRTAGFTANLFYTSRESGLGRGFTHYEDYRRSRRQLELSSALGQRLDELRRGRQPARRDNDRKPGEEVTGRFLTWSQEHDDRPFFAFLNYFDAHEPYRAPRPWRAQFAADSERVDRYDASIAFLDHQLDTILTVLRQRGKLQNTIVIFTSDHGELHGEHGLDGHGNALYDRQLHVPLVIWYPGQQTGSRVQETVSLRRIPSTILDLAGFSDTMPGESLRRVWQGDGEGRLPVFSETRRGIQTPPEDHNTAGDMRSVYFDGLHYIVNGDGTLEAYDLTRDPSETHNVVDLDDYRSRMGHLSGLVDSLWNQAATGEGRDEN